jgi:hypothetical protein
VGGVGSMVLVLEFLQLDLLDVFVVDLLEVVLVGQIDEVAGHVGRAVVVGGPASAAVEWVCELNRLYLVGLYAE